jgi:hypothetical protein
MILKNKKFNNQLYNLTLLFFRNISWNTHFNIESQIDNIDNDK